MAMQAAQDVMEDAVRFNFWLPAALHAAMVELAAANDRPIAREYRRALAAWVEHHAEGQPPA